MSDANVIPLHPLDNAEALGWLRAQPDGRIETSISDLARQFGWPRSKLQRRLATWVASGQITRRGGRRGKIVIATAAQPFDRAPVAMPGPDRSIDSPAAIVASSDPPEPNLPPARESGRRVVALATATALLVTGLGLAAVGLVMNARFAASFGQTAEAAVLLAAIGLAADVLAVLLPSVGAQLWRHGARPAALIAWTLWSLALMMTLLAASGFASTNIGDAVAGRAKLAGESSVLAERIEQLRSERAAITEARAADAVEAELQEAQPAAQAVWKVTSGCRDVTRASSGRICATVLSLREELAAARHRDAIDADLGEAQTKLAALPAIGAADPQAAMAAEMVAWISGGRIAPSPRDVYRLRTLGLTLVPSLAGLVTMLALSLAQARRRLQAVAGPGLDADFAFQRSAMR